jgi:hypothetical protein
MRLTLHARHGAHAGKEVCFVHFIIQENVMLKARILSPLLVAAGLAALPAWSNSTSHAVILSPSREVVIVETAPPPLRTEIVPAPRVGYVWAPGYWNWDGSRYVWVDGRYLESQPGVVYVAPRYEPSNGRYAYYGERWVEDPNKPNPLGNSRVNPLQPSAGQ